MTKKISILGAGESGIGAALLGQSLGYDVFVSDKGQIAAPRIAELKSGSVRGQQSDGIVATVGVHNL